MSRKWKLLWPLLVYWNKPRHKHIYVRAIISSGLSRHMSHYFYPSQIARHLEDKNSLLYKWEKKTWSRHRKIAMVLSKVKISWKVANFQLLRVPSFSETFYFNQFFFTWIFLYTSLKDHSRRPLLETVNHCIASQYLPISNVRDVDKMITKLMLCSQVA